MLDKFSFLATRCRRSATRRARPSRERRRLVFESFEDRRMLATLGVSIDRDVVLERSGEGAARAAIVRDTTDTALTINLSSSDTSEITVQSTVTMAPGVGSVVVPLNAIDDALLDGTQTVTITATAPGWTAGSDTIEVRDIEHLSLALADNSLALGESTTATVTRHNTDIDAPLTIDIGDDHAADLVVPDRVEIPAGQSTVQFGVSIVDNGIVDGTRTLRLSGHHDGYFPGSDVLEIREDEVEGVRAATDGHAVDVDRNGTFSELVMNSYSLKARNWAREHRALMEFDIASIGGVVEDASLTFRLDGYSTNFGIGPTVEFYGYTGDGMLTAEDATAGRKVGEFQVPATDAARRYAIPLDLTWLQSLVGTARYAGISARVVDGSSVSFVSSRNPVMHASNHPTLQFLLAPDQTLNAADDAARTDEDVAVAIDVLGNDFGEGLEIAQVGTPRHGKVTVNDDQTLTYTPASNFHGVDSFDYTLRDATGATDSAEVQVTVDPVNDRPIARNDVVTTVEDTSVVIDALANDLDVDGDPLSFDRVIRPTHGTVARNDDGTLTYTPNANYFGSDSFAYSVTDGQGGYARAFVFIDVAPVNDDPAVVDAVFAIEENSPNGFQVGQIEATDVEADPLTFALQGEDAAAFAVDARTGVITVADTSLLDYETQPQFDFQAVVTDGYGGSATAAVSVRLTDVLEVAIDVLPDDPLNQLRHQSRWIEVAVLAARNFDPLEQLDLSSLRLRAASSTSGAAIDSHPRHGYRYDQRDVDGDGLLDLVLRFSTSDTGLPGDKTGLQEGESAVVLEGSLLPQFGGGSFSVEQAIRIVRGNGRGQGG